MRIFALIAFGLAILSAFIVRGTFGHTIIILAIGVYLGAPLMLFMGIWLLVGIKRSNRVPQGLKRVFLGSAIVGVSLGTSLLLGKFLHRLEIHRTRNYVTDMVPKLEQYRTEHGRYPESLALFPGPRPPRLLQGRNCYRAEVDSFRFEFWDAAGMMDGYCFDSSTREWSYFD